MLPMAIVATDLASSSSRAGSAHYSGLTLRDIIVALRRRIRLILAFGICGAGLVFALFSLLPPTYEASAVVAVDSTAPTFESADGQARNSGDPVANKIELIESQAILGQVVDEQWLLSDPQFNPPPFFGPSDRAATVLAAWVPEDWLVRVGLAAEGDEAATVSALEPLMVRQRAIDRLRARLVVAQPPGAEMLRVSIRTTDAAQAADIANAIAVAYVSWEKNDQRQTARDTAGVMQQELTGLQKDLEKAERAVAEFRNSHGLSAGGGSGGTLNDQWVVDLRAQLVALRSEQMVKQGQLQRAQAAAGRGGDALADLGASAPIVLSLRSQQGELERRRAELALSFGKRHPQMLSIDTQIDELGRKLALETGRAIASIQDELTAINGRQAAVERDLAELQKNAVVDRQAEVQLQELERQANAARNLYETMLNRFRQAEQTANIGGTDARIVSGATTPLTPVTPSPLILGLVGFAAFTIVGSALSLLLESMDRRVQTSHQVEQALGVPSLGVLPYIRKRKWRNRPASYLVDQPFTYYAEAAQSIVMQLDAVSGEPGPKSLVVTSALPSEGKTTLVVSIAAALARTGLKVCVLDLDLRRPAVAARIGLSKARPDLMDYLAGRALLDEAVRPAPRGGFDLVPVEHPSENALVLLKSAAFTQLWNELQRRYDIVVVDSAPMLALSETQAVCRLARHFIVAARWKHTDTVAAGEVIRRLAAQNPKFVGVVLTMVDIVKYKLYAHGEAGSYYHRSAKYYSS